MDIVAEFGALLAFFALIWGAVSVLPAMMHAAPPKFSNTTMQSGNMVAASDTGDGVDWDDVIAFQYGHSDPSHTVSSPEAREQMRQAVSAWQVAISSPNPGGGDPENIICKVTQMVKGATYVALWVASSADPMMGTVSVYNADAGQWVTSYSGKARDIFVNGKPRGSTDSSIIPCKDSGVNPPMAPAG